MGTIILLITFTETEKHPLRQSIIKANALKKIISNAASEVALYENSSSFYEFLFPAHTLFAFFSCVYPDCKAARKESNVQEKQEVSSVPKVILRIVLNLSVCPIVEFCATLMCGRSVTLRHKDTVPQKSSKTKPLGGASVRA